MIAAILLAAAPVPSRIVSNNPCVDAILAELVPTSRIAAISTYSHDARSTSVDLRWARRLPAIGDTAEEVVVAKPDLFLTGSLTSAATRLAVRRMGVRTIEIVVPQSVAESRAQVRTIAAAVGTRARGERLVARIDAAIASAATRDKPVAALLWMSGGLVPGSGTFPDELLRRAGFSNASAGYGLRQWGTLPIEPVLRRPPAVVLSPSAAPHTLRHRLLRRLGTRHAVFPEALLFCGGPTIVRAMARLQTIRRSF